MGVSPFREKTQKEEGEGRLTRRQEVKDRRLVSVNKFEIRISDIRSRSFHGRYRRWSPSTDLLTTQQISVAYNYLRIQGLVQYRELVIHQN